MRIIFSIILITLLSGCAAKKQDVSADSWAQAPTLHDVPDEPEPLEKKQLDQKEQELRTKHKEKSVGLTVVTK